MTRNYIRIRHAYAILDLLKTDGRDLETVDKLRAVYMEVKSLLSESNKAKLQQAEESWVHSQRIIDKIFSKKQEWHD